MVEPIGYPTAMLAKSASELRGYGFARSAHGRPRALLAPELAPEHVPGACARGGVLQLWWGDRGAVYPPRPHTARTRHPHFWATH